MEWNTPVSISPQPGLITRNRRVLMFGSCFAEHVGRRMLEYHFPIELNPFGIQYNPYSIGTTFSRLLDGRRFTTDDLFFDGNLWHSFAHHSSFSHTDPALCLKSINDRFDAAEGALYDARALILTWGTAWVYTLSDGGEVVANCHKMPASMFSRRRLSVEEMYVHWCGWLDMLFARNREIEVLFTVSPVRHLKDGAHGNQLSKSALLLFTDELCRTYPDRCHYFPAYEIVMDELRDYRFYDTDMLHPSSVAVDYVWERFSETYFDEETRSVNREWTSILKALQHRQLTPDDESFRRFSMQNILKLKNFQKKYPYFDVSKELEVVRQELETKGF